MNARTSIRRARRMLLVVMWLFPVPALRADEIVTLTATADATLQLAFPATNDGATALVRILGESVTKQRTLVRFDLSPIASTSAVKVASLKMKVAAPPVVARSQAVHRVTGATQWTEVGATWNTRNGVTAWTAAGGDFSAAINTQSSGAAAGATITWPILTDGVIPNIPQDWVNTPANNNGLLVKDSTETDSARAVLKCLYTGAAASAGNGTVTVTLPNLGGACTGTINTARSFLIFQTNNTTNRPVTFEIRGRIFSATQLQFTRNTNEATTVNIRWYVAEFERGIAVQRGVVNFQSAATINATAANSTPAFGSVSALSQAFVLWSKTPISTDNTFNQDDPGLAELTATNNLQFRFNQSNIGHTINWEVIEFTNAADISVQKGNIAGMAAGTATVTAAITAVDPAKSFVLVSYRIPGGSGSEGQLMLRGQLTSCAPNCNQVTIDRTVTGTAIAEIAYQVVTLNTGASVQTASTNFPIATATLSPALTTVDLTRTLAFASSGAGGGQNVGRTAMASPTAQSLGASTFTTALAAGAITLTRQNTAAAADVSWYVLQLNNTSPGGVSYASKEDATPSNRPQLDVRILRDVSLGTITPGVSEITLNFTFPAGATAANYQGVMIARKNGAAAPTFAPVDGTAYALGSQPVAGETVVANANNFTASPTNVAVLDENGPNSVISPVTQYSFKLYTRDNNTITGAASAAPPHYSFGGAATGTATAAVGGGANKNWSYKTAGTTLAPPGLDPGNKVVAGSNDNNLHSMGSTTGARNYQPAGSNGTTGGVIQSRPAIISQGDTNLADCDSLTPGLQPCDVAYAGSADGRVYAFNAATGQRIWVTPAPGSPGALVAVGGTIQGGIALELRRYASATFQAFDCDSVTPGQQTCDLLFVGTREISVTSNKVHALNGNTGAIVWTFSPGNMDGVNSMPAVDYANNVVWVSSLSNGGAQPSLWKINGLTGAPISNFSLGNISGSPTINADNRVVYAVTDTGNLVAVRNDIAACAKTFVTGATSGTGFPNVIGTGALRDENVFFTTTTAVVSTVRKVHFVYNPACGGETFAAAAGYTNPVFAATLSGPVINPLTNFIYAGASDGRLYKMDSASGAVLANRLVNSGLTIGEPSIDIYLSKLFAGDAQGRVYSFDIF
ncbi:MAG: DNRLRE domain-containing protein [Acidobacteria bacterium]|nr:DNRLRE domain-containing protein [Acidobacteriota bacterium]